MFRTRIRELRELSGFSSQQSFGVAQSTVGNWEAGKREPKYETTMKLADFFQVSVDYLLGRDDIKHTIRTNEPISILFSMYSITVKQFAAISGLKYDLVDHLSVVADPLDKPSNRKWYYDSISDEQYKKINDFFHVSINKRDERGECELPLYPNKKVVDKIRELVESTSPQERINEILAELERKSRDMDARISAIESKNTREYITPPSTGSADKAV